MHVIGEIDDGNKWDKRKITKKRLLYSDEHNWAVAQRVLMRKTILKDFNLEAIPHLPQPDITAKPFEASNSPSIAIGQTGGE